MQTINAAGWECPKPIIHTKRVLDALDKGSVCTIVDNETAYQNLLNFGTDMGYEVSYEKKDELWHIYTVKPEGMKARSNQKPEDLLVLITGDLFGKGSEDLSRVLMKSYIYTLNEVMPRPNTVIFMNSGVFLNIENSPVSDTLEGMEMSGVEIMTCGACLDYYGVKEQLLTGVVSNMYQIVEKMNGADKVIRL